MDLWEAIGERSRSLGRAPRPTLSALGWLGTDFGEISDHGLGWWGTDFGEISDYGLGWLGTDFGEISDYGLGWWGTDFGEISDYAPLSCWRRRGGEVWEHY